MPVKPDQGPWLVAFLRLLLAVILSVLLIPPAPPDVTVMEIEPKDAPVVFEFVGITESSQQVEVRARVDGFLEDRLYTEGSIVEKGEVMFRMDAKPFKAQLDAAKAAPAEQEARLWTARADLKRVKPGGYLRRAVILSLVSAVATSYVTLLQLDRQLVVARETLETRDESLELFELKLKAGVVSELEVAQVKTEYEQAAAAIPSLERRIGLTENAIAVLLGHNPREIPRGKTIDKLLQPDVPAGVPAQLLERRPDIRSTEQDLIAADARIDVARAQYFPTISLTGLFGYASDGLSDLLQNSAKTWNLGGTALGPIFSGGRIEAQRDADETDFPSQQPETEPRYDFPGVTQPSGTEPVSGYQ